MAQAASKPVSTVANDMRAAFVLVERGPPRSKALRIVDASAAFWEIAEVHRSDLGGGTFRLELDQTRDTDQGLVEELDWMRTDDGHRCVHAWLTADDAEEEEGCDDEEQRPPRQTTTSLTAAGGTTTTSHDPPKKRQRVVRDAAQDDEREDEHEEKSQPQQQQQEETAAATLRRTEAPPPSKKKPPPPPSSRPLPMLLLETSSSTTDRRFGATIVAEFVYRGLYPTIQLWLWFPKAGSEYINDAFWDQLGYDKQLRYPAHKPDSWCSLILPESLDTAMTSFRVMESTKGAMPYDQRVTYKRLDGSILQLRCQGTPILWSSDDRCLAMVGAHTDVTAENKDRLSKISFIGKMSHEIRTPLNAICGSLETLSEFMASAPTDVREVWTTLHTATTQIQAVVDDVLDFSALSSGNVRLSKSAFSLASLLDEARKLHASTAAAKNISLKVTTPRDFPAKIIADRTRLMQVMSNLLSNAIKFTPEDGTVEVTVVRTTLDTSSGVHFTLDVSDSGCGIPRSAWERVFEDFRQVRVADSMVGTGLGLSICSLLVGLHGGRIFVFDSDPSRGTTIRVQLDTPVTGVSDDGAERRGDTSAAAAAALGGGGLGGGGDGHQNDGKGGLALGRVLVVDDVKTNRTVLAALLKKVDADAQVHFAENGQAAVSLCLASEFDLIFMDVHMPVMDGIEATKLITSKKQASSVVGLTANTDASLKEACLAAGMREVVLKPTTSRMIAATVARLRTKYGPAAVTAAAGGSSPASSPPPPPRMVTS